MIDSNRHPVYVGQRILVEIEYRLNGNPTDPTIVQYTYRSPLGVTATVTYPDEAFIRRSEGLYDASILVDEPGTWIIRGEGAGIVDGVNELAQEVLASGLSG
jgi:hypothetical protein